MNDREAAGMVRSEVEPPLDVFNPRCPSRGALWDVTGRWAPLILLALDDGLSRFGDLRRCIGGLSERMLSQTLSALTRDGLVDRSEDSGGRPFYSLTDGGVVVAARVRGLRDALYAHLEEAEVSRAAVD